MPPEPLFDLSQIDTSKIIADREAIAKVNPHRFEFAQLDGIYLCDPDRGVVVGYRDVHEDEFWVRGHIPGRPIFPGVLMIETAAQLFSYFVVTSSTESGFLGFGGVREAKFRGAVVPGQRIIMIGSRVESRRRRHVGATQAFVDGQMVYEGTIIGMWV